MVCGSVRPARRARRSSSSELRIAGVDGVMEASERGFVAWCLVALPPGSCSTPHQKSRELSRAGLMPKEIAGPARRHECDRHDRLVGRDGDRPARRAIRDATRVAANARRRTKAGPRGRSARSVDACARCLGDRRWRAPLPASMAGQVCRSRARIGRRKMSTNAAAIGARHAQAVIASAWVGRWSANAEKKIVPRAATPTALASCCIASSTPVAEPTRPYRHRRG